MKHFQSVRRVLCLLQNSYAMSIPSASRYWPIVSMVLSSAALFLSASASDAHILSKQTRASSFADADGSIGKRNLIRAAWLSKLSRPGMIEISRLTSFCI